MWDTVSAPRRSWDEVKEYLDGDRNLYNYLVGKTRAWLKIINSSVDWFEWLPVQTKAFEQLVFCGVTQKFVPEHLLGCSPEQMAAEAAVDPSQALLYYLQGQYDPAVQYPAEEEAPSVAEAGVQTSRSEFKWHRDSTKTYTNNPVVAAAHLIRPVAITAPTIPMQRQQQQRHYEAYQAPYLVPDYLLDSVMLLEEDRPATLIPVVQPGVLLTDMVVHVSSGCVVTRQLVPGYLLPSSL